MLRNEDEVRCVVNDATLNFQAMEKIIFKIVEEGDTSEDNLNRLGMWLERFGSDFDDLLILIDEELDEG